MTEDAIRFWTRAGAATAIASLTLSLAFPSYGFVGMEPPLPDDSMRTIAIAVLVPLAVGLLWRSRIAAILALVGAGSGPFIRWTWASLWPWVLVDIIAIAVHLRAFDAIVAHHAAKAPPSRISRNVRRTLKACAVVALLTVAWLTGTMPAMQVVSGGQLPRTYQRALDDVGLLESGERVHYMSSDAPVRVSSAMYVLTDRRLILHNTSWSPPTHRIPFAAIADVMFFPGEGVWVPSYLTVVIEDKTALSFALSTAGGGDVRFHDALLDAWQPHRPIRPHGDVASSSW